MSTRASAARYARALLDITIKESDPIAAESDLAGFVGLVQRNSDLQRTFANPVVPASAKRAVVQQLVERSQPAAPVAKLLLLLASRGRLELVRDVLEVYRERLRDYRQIIQAEVTTAAPLPPEQITELRERLAQITGRTVTLTTRIDQAIIGGVVTRIGSTVYDGSVATQLAKVREKLSERS
jgi:F-type H+-transporting ATPase subunit delta